MGIKVRNEKLAHWLRMDMWNEDELIQLCAGYDQMTFFGDGEAIARFEKVCPELQEEVRRAAIAETLKAINKPATGFFAQGTYNFKKEDAIRWAGSRYSDFPFEWSDEKEISHSAMPVESTTMEAQAPADGVQITLPHMTERLEKLFTIMRDSWGKYDPLLIPKQDNIARAISEALGYSPDSREGKVLAALIKPDELREADARANKKRGDSEV